MNTNGKLYNKIINISDWERKPGESPSFLPIAQDPNGKKYLIKSQLPFSRVNEMIVTKACKKAGFDAVDNEFAYDENSDTKSLITPMMDYGMISIAHYIPYMDASVLDTLICKFFNDNPLLNEKFKSRYVDEALLRALFEDPDSMFCRNLAIKANKEDSKDSHNGNVPIIPINELELTSSYDFNNCLARDLETRGHSHKREVATNLKFIKKNYPKNAEQFFANFSFDNATLDELFDLHGIPLEWLLKHREFDPNAYGHYSEKRKQLILNGQLNTAKKTKSTIDVLSKSTRQQFKENLVFMKDTFAKA